MKTLSILFFLTLLIQLNCFSQKIIEREYFNMFGERLEFMKDSSFRHTWHFDLASSWTNGKWRILNDTIYLTPKLIFDTLTIRNPENIIIKDSLVLSNYETSERVENAQYIMYLISSGGQNRIQPPSKLFIKNGRLYRILYNGKIDFGKQEAILSHKKYKTYFEPIKK